MSTSSELSPWKRIFHPSDFGRGSHTAFAHALRLAVSLGAELELAHVSAQSRNGFGSLPGVRETLSRWRSAQGDDLPAARMKVRKTTITGDRAATSLLGYLESHPAELVVLTTHQRKGWERLRQGETASRVGRQASRAALVIPRNAQGFVDRDTGVLQLRNILVPIDHQPSPRTTIARLDHFLARLGIEAVQSRLLHVCENDETPPSVRLSSGRADTNWTYDVRSGDTLETIIENASPEAADLLVLASEGRTGIGYALQGSMAERILRSVAIPVLLLPRLKG